MKVHLKKTYEGHFIPADDEAAQWAVKQKVGEVVYADFKRARNYQFHKKYFGMLQMVYENQSRYPTLETLREAAQIAAGYCDIIYMLNGETGIKSKSISFGRMSQHEFEKLYSDVLNVILKHFGFGKEFELELILQFG